MGPSGAGKDTLLLGAREKLSRDGNHNIEFVKRAITRSADKITDLEISMTNEDFHAASKRGEFALQYSANNTHYAIPKASLDAGIAAGKRMVLNVSRTVIDQVRDEFGRQGVEVYCLNITASDEILKTRLLGRGRESATEIEQRIKRAKMLTPEGSHVIGIVNEASTEEGIDLVSKALTGKMKYSLWLSPSRDSIFNVAANAEIHRLAATHGAHPFPAHITVGKSFIASQAEAVRFAQVAAEAIGAPVQANIREVTTSTAKFRATVIEVEKTSEICDACSIVRRLTPFDHEKSFHDIAQDVRQTYAPHVSFLYGEYDAGTLSDAKESLQQAISFSPSLSSGFEAAELVLVMTSGPYHCWNEVARFPLRTRSSL